MTDEAQEDTWLLSDGSLATWFMWNTGQSVTTCVLHSFLTNLPTHLPTHL